MASYKCFTPATRQPRSRFFKDKTVVQKYFENTQFNYALITSQLSDNDGTLHAPCLKHIYVLWDSNYNQPLDSHEAAYSNSQNKEKVNN